jgi:hypothetical protein
MATTDDGHHRTKNFFLRDAHFRRHVCENCRLIKRSVLAVLAGGVFATDEKFRSLVTADLHVVVNFGALTFVDERTDIRFGLEAVAQL